MKTAGFFRELEPNGPAVYGTSIRDHLGDDSPPPDLDQVVDYLRRGHGLIDVMGAETDVLGTGRHILGGASIMTDGEWLWREDLQFYVSTHHVRLPGEFLTRIRERRYEVPALPPDVLRVAGEEALRLLNYR